MSLDIDSLIASVETLPFNTDIKLSDGEFITLESGITHYQWNGNGTKGPIVLTHGFSTPYFIYDIIYNQLVANGYKVLRYDLLGRGYSERVYGEYTPSLFAKQLYELTTAIFGDEHFYLIGTSMGGTITTTFCLLYPGRVIKLILLAPAGMDSFYAPLYMQICRIPFIGDAIFNNILPSTLIRNCTNEFKYSNEETKNLFTIKFAESIKYQGFTRCTLSSLRNTILNLTESMKGYYSVAEQKIPLLVIWGTEDNVMPYYQHKRLLEVCPEAKLVTFEGSGHLFLYDEGERTFQEILLFL